jgi:N-acetylglucosaminyldiphosphoundecaprenol N-acetyl-beta-D-mannosaminyltransferase
MFILGVRVDNVTSQTAMALLKVFASHHNGSNPRKVFFVNVHSIQSARRDHELMSCVNSADLVLPDGSGLKIAGKIFGTPIIENLNGTDFSPKVLRYAESRGLTVYLLGARPRVIEGCLDHLRKSYSRLQIVGYHHGYLSAEEHEAVIEDINSKRPDILLVAFGTPTQEKWIAHNARNLNVGVCLAVGGLFDFLSGAIVRAPIWMRRSGMEWLFRFFQDPAGKWNRVFVEIPVFLGRVAARRFIPRPLQQFIYRTLIFR